MTTAIAPTTQGRPVEERGHTTISERVVERLATKVVAEVDAASGASRRIFGQQLGRTTEDTRARASAHINGRVVTLSLAMSVAWPQSVRAVTREVRSTVRARVGALTGLEVGYVDISVPSLLTAFTDEPRVR